MFLPLDSHEAASFLVCCYAAIVTLSPQLNAEVTMLDVCALQVLLRSKEQRSLRLSQSILYTICRGGAILKKRPESGTDTGSEGHKLHMRPGRSQEFQTHSRATKTNAATRTQPKAVSSLEKPFPLICTHSKQERKIHLPEEHIQSIHWKRGGPQIE